MAEIVSEAVEHGALGFTSSRTMLHRALDGEPVPGTFAGAEEITALGKAVADAGGGVVEVASDIGLGGWRATSAPISNGCATSRPNTASRSPTHWLRPTPPESVERSPGDVVSPRRGRWEGAGPGRRPPGRTAPRDGDLAQPLHETPDLYGPRRLATGTNGGPSWPNLRSRPPFFRRRQPSPGRFNRDIAHGFHKMYPLGSEPDYEPDASDCIEARAEREGRDSYEYAYDVLFAEGDQGLIFFPLTDFAEHNLNPTLERLRHHGAFLSLSDGGAHCRLICDASTPTYLPEPLGPRSDQGPQARD